MIRNYGDVLSQMDSFLKKVAAEKKEAGYGGPDDDAKKEPHGSTSTTVANAASAQGQAGSEKSSDLNAAVDGINADSNEAKVKAGDADQPADTQGPNSLSADETVDEGDNMIKCTEIQKEARAAQLGNRILSKVASMRPAAPAPAAAPSFLQKVAAENPALAEQMSAAYHDFALGFLRGYEKKAEDMHEVLQSGIVKTAQEAEAVLDEVAAEDPAAVAPEEAYVEAPAEEGAVDEAAALDQIAEVMAEQGITPEEVMEAAAEIEELKAAGFTDEDIIQASQEIAAEAAPAEEAAPELEKVASADRVRILKDYMRRK